MRDRLIKLLATGFGIGYLPVAPGTAGSLLGVLVWWLVARTGHRWEWWLYAALIALAIWVAGEAAEIMRHPDPPAVVIDEIVAIPIAMAGLNPVWWQVALAFALFRLFDVWKPPPIRQSQAFAGGVGIVLDDLLAAIYACATTHVLVWLFHWLKR